jgi:23S rRNA G2445 N2-methylase RlmL
VKTARTDVDATRGFVLTTHVGLEARACADLRALGLEAATSEGSEEEPGRVRVRVDDRHLPALLALRSVHHVGRPCGARRFEPMTLDALAEWAATLAIPELDGSPNGPSAASEGSFVVRCEREGTHDFTSPDVERAVGAALATRRGRPVSLKHPDVRIAVDVVGSLVTLDVRLTEPALSHRGYPRPYQQRTALKADVAYACLRAAEEALGRPPTRVIDPFCGSGTILLEAAELFPDARLFGSDKKPTAAEGARANLAAFGHAARATIVTAELDLAARRLRLARSFGDGERDRIGEIHRARIVVVDVDVDVVVNGDVVGDGDGTVSRASDREPDGGREPDRPLDALVTNPPYGVRMGARLDFRQLYARLFQAFDVPVRVVLATEEEALHEAAAALGLRAEVVARPRTGSVSPAIFVVTRR